MTVASNPSSISPEVIEAIARDGGTEVVWLVYHSCCDHHVAIRRFADGFQPTPWKCAFCGWEAEQSDLTYRLELRKAMAK